VKNLKFVIGLLLFVGVLVIGSSMTMAQRMPIEDVIIPTLSVHGNNSVGATFQRGFDNLAIATPTAPVVASVGMTCSEDNDGDGDTDSCSCPSNDSQCMGDLIAWCSADGDYLTGDTKTTTCIAGGTPSSSND
jgi:hypothetical protein